MPEAKAFVAQHPGPAHLLQGMGRTLPEAQTAVIVCSRWLQLCRGAAHPRLDKLIKRERPLQNESLDLPEGCLQRPGALFRPVPRGFLEMLIPTDENVDQEPRSCSFIKRSCHTTTVISRRLNEQEGG